MMDIEKSVAKYSKNFHTVLVKGNFPNISKHIAAYRARLSEMYASENTTFIPPQIRRTSMR